MVYSFTLIMFYLYIAHGLPSTDEETRIALTTVSKRYSSIKSVELAYRLPNNRLTERQSPFLFCRIEMAYPDILRHFKSHCTTQIQPTDDPLQQFAICNGDVVENHYLFQRTFFKKKLPAGLQFPGSLPEEILFVTTGIWPFAPQIRPSPKINKTIAISIIDVLDSDKYSPSLADGKLLLHSANDHLAFNVESGLLERRDFFSDNKILMSTFELENTPKNDKCLIRKIHYRFFDHNCSSPRHVDRVVNSGTIQFDSFTLNTFKSDKASPVQGSVDIGENIGDVHTVVRDDAEDYIQKASTWLRDHYPIEKKGLTGKPFFDSLRLGIFLFFGLATFLIINFSSLLKSIGSSTYH